jgi:ElaB/YqjD/DUF883 family membrane-anchored ribosome-binding protein
LTIIDDILDISKIEANRMVIESIPFTVRGTVFNYGLRSSVSNVNWVIPMIPFIGVLISCDILAKNSDFVNASGEMDELKRKINKMVSNLRDSIQRNTAAREADISRVYGLRSSVSNVNWVIPMIPFIGVLISCDISVNASGEMDELKRKINKMVSNLRDSIQRNTAARVGDFTKRADLRC